MNGADMQNTNEKRATVRSKQRRTWSGRAVKVFAVFVDGTFRKAHGRDRQAAFRHARQVNSRRTAEQREAARATLLAGMTSRWEQVEADYESDLRALVQAGLVERRVVSSYVPADVRDGLFGNPVRKWTRAEYRLAAKLA